MEKLASIYERKGMLFVSAEHRTQAGFWIGDEQLVSLDQPTPEELGTAIKLALARSQNDVPTPSRDARLDRPLLKAASVGSWRTFMLMSKHVSVSSDGNVLHIEPWRNAGVKAGFEPQTDRTVQCSASISSSQLGEAIAGLLAQCC